MLKNKKSMFAVVSIVILITFGVLFYYFIYNKTKVQEIVPPTTQRSSDQQKLDILSKLSSESKSPDLSVKEKQAIIKNLNKNTTNNKPISDAEKLDLLNRLSHQ